MTLVLLTGAAASHALIVAVSPLLTRLYAPESFGIAAIYLALLGVGSTIVCLRYDVAIPVATDDRTAAALLSGAIVAAFLIAGVSGVIAYLLGADLMRALQADALTPWLWLVPIGLLLTGIQQPLMYWTLRTRGAARMSTGRFAQSAVLVVTQLAAGARGYGVIGLIGGHPIARMTHILVLAPVAPWPLLRELRPRAAVRVCLRYRRYPLLTSWSALLNAISVQVPVLVLSVLFTPVVVGWFSLTTRILQIPATVAAQAVGQAFYAHASQASDTNERHLYAVTIYRTLLAIGTGPMAVLAIAGGPAFAALFGSDWRDAGLFAAWLAPWTLIVFAASPLSTTVFLAGRQGSELLFQGATLILRLIALVVGGIGGDANVSVALFGITSFLLWAPYAAWLLRLNGVGLRTWASISAREVLAATAMVAPLAVVFAARLSAPWVIAAAILAIGLYLRHAGKTLARAQV